MLQDSSESPDTYVPRRPSDRLERFTSEVAKKLRVRSNVSRSEAARLRDQAMQPFEPEPLNRRRSSTLGTGQKIDSRTDTQDQRWLQRLRVPIHPLLLTWCTERAPNDVRVRRHHLLDQTPLRLGRDIPERRTDGARHPHAGQIPAHALDESCEDIWCCAVEEMRDRVLATLIENAPHQILDQRCEYILLLRPSCTATRLGGRRGIHVSRHRGPAEPEGSDGQWSKGEHCRSRRNHPATPRRL